MEMFTGDRRVPNDVVVFPDNLTPFPETGDILSDDRDSELRSPDIERRSQPPPQKLRPIRCSGRNLPEYSDPAAPENSGLDGSLLSCYGVVSPELGFLSQLSTQELSVVNGVPEECGVTQAYHGSGAFPGNGGSGGGAAGNTYSLVDSPTMQQIKSEMDAECRNLISQRLFLEDELSSSSDDGSESLDTTKMKEPLNRKRKRKTRRKFKLFLEGMMGKVMQKQEQMHSQLIEMLEKKEKERIIREEAWKQKEIDRAKRDEEVRTQETSRSLALISFIQNMLGHDIQIPKSIETSFLDKDDGEIHNQEDFKCDPSNRRWPKSEVQALITVRTALDQKFFLSSPKGSVWEEVAVGLSRMGYSRTARKCKEKWENINKYYKKTMESTKKRPESSKSCSYFHELDILYKSGLITFRNDLNYIKAKFEDKRVKEE